MLIQILLLWIREPKLETISQFNYKSGEIFGYYKETHSQTQLMWLVMVDIMNKTLSLYDNFTCLKNKIWIPVALSVKSSLQETKITNRHAHSSTVAMEKWNTELWSCCKRGYCRGRKSDVILRSQYQITEWCHCALVMMSSNTCVAHSLVSLWTYSCITFLCMN